ncbi:MAG: hypothetical protein ACFFHV_21795, partial [Promethearchaeota archaeon]
MSKKKIIVILLFFTISVSSTGMLYLYIFFFTAISSSLNQYEGMWSITIFILIRIIITIGMMIYAFWQWNIQKKLNFENIDFLIGLFFLGLVYGKLINLLYILTFYTINENTSLIILKFRYVLIVLTAAPLISLGMDILFPSNHNKNDNLIENHYKITLNIILVLLIVILSTTLIIIAPNLTILNIILISFHISSLLWISFTFYYAYRKNLLSQIRPLIISSAFLIDLILYASAILTSSLRQNTIG